MRWLPPNEALDSWPTRPHKSRLSPPMRKRRARREAAIVLLLMALVALACKYSTFSTGGSIPPQAQSAIETFSADVGAGRYEKVYNEAADEWRRTMSVEQTTDIFRTLKEKLGAVKSRTVQTVRDQENTGGDLPGHSLVIIYQTTFERAEAMETVTLVEREGRWLMARYFVSSSALK